MAKRIRNGIFIALDIFALIYFFQNQEILLIENRSVVMKCVIAGIVCMLPGVIFGDGKGERCPELYKKLQSFIWRFRHLLSLVFLVVIPPLAFLNEEAIYGAKLSEFGLRRIGLGLIIVLSVLGLLFLLINNMQISLNLIVVSLTIFALTNYYVNAFRGSPAIASDIYSIKTALSVSNNYAYEVKWGVFRGILYSLLMVQVVYLIPMHRAMSLKIRLGFAALWGVCCIGFYGIFFKTNYFEKTFSNYRFSYFHPNTSYKNYGSVLIFTLSIKKMQVKVPDGYKDSTVSEYMESYLTENPSDSISENTQDMPNIIVIMDEAFCDLTDRELTATEDPIPFFHSLSENTIKGKLYVSVFGGNTANTEYEVLTGNTMAFLPSGTIAYQMYVKENAISLSKNLLGLGYGGDIAMHPYKANGFNRPRAYSCLGFTDFLSEEAFSNPVYVRKYISDESDFQKIIELYEEYKNGTGQYGIPKSEVGATAPFYLFNVSMQNHSGYDVEGFETPIQFQGIEGKYAEAEQYINLTKLTDNALESLITYFSNEEKDTIIVFFGDHKPGLSTKFLKEYSGIKSLDEEAEFDVKYSVDYFIWANYDIEEQTGVDMSANYLGAYVSQVAGLPLTGYQKYLLDLQEDIPAITLRGYRDKENHYYSLDDEESALYDLVSGYSKIQYNNLFGKQYEAFFGYAQ